jgi:hypothetical protein
VQSNYALLPTRAPQSAFENNSFGALCKSPAKDFSLSLLAARQVWSNILLDSILSQQFVDIRKKGLFGLLLWGPHTLLTPAALKPAAA